MMTKNQALLIFSNGKNDWSVKLRESFNGLPATLSNLRGPSEDIYRATFVLDSNGSLLKNRLGSIKGGND